MCKQCDIERKTRIFIQKSKKRFGENTFSYYNTVFKNAKTKIKIECKKHGVMQQFPGNHLKMIFGCKKCASQNCSQQYLLPVQNFIEKANKVHNFKYDYSKTKNILKLKNGRRQYYVNISCGSHGQFIQRKPDHISGSGCPKCRDEQCGKRFEMTQDEFIQKAQKFIIIDIVMII